MGMKPSDALTVPLYWRQHALQHEIGEELFWEPYGGTERAKELARQLYENTGNREKCLRIIARFRYDLQDNK